MTKAEAGRLGGLATSRKYGPDYMAALGRRGAAAWHRKYNLIPYGVSGFAVQRRDTGELTKLLSGRPF